MTYQLLINHIDAEDIEDRFRCWLKRNNLQENQVYHFLIAFKAVTSTPIEVEINKPFNVNGIVKSFTFSFDTNCIALSIKADVNLDTYIPYNLIDYIQFSV